MVAWNPDSRLKPLSDSYIPLSPLLSITLHMNNRFLTGTCNDHCASVIYFDYQRADFCGGLSDGQEGKAMTARSRDLWLSYFSALPLSAGFHKFACVFRQPLTHPDESWRPLPASGGGKKDRNLTPHPFGERGRG